MILSGPAAHFQLGLVIDPLAVVGLPLPHSPLLLECEARVDRIALTGHQRCRSLYLFGVVL